MKKLIIEVEKREDFELREVEDIPICGKDLCDRCGTCLACHQGNGCYNGEHLWIVYVKSSVNSYLTGNTNE